MDSKKTKKAKTDDENVEDRDGEGEEEEDVDAEKSDLSTSDLEKSLGKLEEYAQANSPEDRKSMLLGKALEGDLEKSEQDELLEILGGTSTPDVLEGDEDLTKGFQSNDTIQKALDVSDYLREQHEELTKSLDAVGEKIQTSQQSQNEFNLVLARAVSDVGRLTKSLMGQVEVMGSQPARAPKSKGIQVPALQKSFAGAPPAEDQLSKEDILDTMETMFQKSEDEGREGVSNGGVDLLSSISKYESFNKLSKSLYAEVQDFRKNAQ